MAREEAKKGNHDMKITKANKKGLTQKEKSTTLRFPEHLLGEEDSVELILTFDGLKIVETKKKDEIFVAEYTLIESDVRKFKPGMKFASFHNPQQEFAETYFWRAVFGLYSAVVLDKKLTDKRATKLAKKNNKEIDALIADKGKHVECEDLLELTVLGALAEADPCTIRVTITSYQKAGDPRWREVLEYHPYHEDDEEEPEEA